MKLRLGQLITPVFALALPATFAASGGPPPVQVQGVVEIINDVLRVPFVKSAAAGTMVSVLRPIVTFDIPDGKRLIIETIAFQTSRPNAESARVFFEPRVVLGEDRLLIPLPIQTESVEGPTTYLISAMPFSMRLDSISGSSTELSFRMGSNTPTFLQVTVAGYLVDL
jgi:hypothetical protein